jgi:glycerol-3-phosphate acyltransferase PlsY
MPWIILGILLSYLIGSVPTAYIFGRVIKGIDIRNHGSGNVGATNALRVLGKGSGLAVLALDMFKGVLAAAFVADWVLARAPGLDSQVLRVLLGFSCICGHNWTIFLEFKGGKGVATTFGVLLALAVKIASLRIVFFLLILTWLAVFVITRIVSLASILTCVGLPVYMAIFKQPVFLVLSAALIAAFIIFRHKSNLTRLWEGKEKRIKL